MNLGLNLDPVGSEFNDFRYRYGSKKLLVVHLHTERLQNSKGALMRQKIKSYSFQTAISL
jgi:hypothetical protein